MPELPEVETVTAALRPHLLGRQLIRVDTFTPQLRTPLDVHQRLEILDVTIDNVQRRAKYIVVSTSNHNAIVVHLGMTGSCRIEPSDHDRLPHDHVVFHLDDGNSWRLNDPRRFGSVEVMECGNDGLPSTRFSALGPEPLSDEFDSAYLYARTRRRRSAIKTLLMDSRIVVGVGNIYASEALFHAGIPPALAAGRLSRRRCTALIGAIQAVLNAAIRAGGTTIADFKTVDGSEGRFVHDLHVYGRHGKPCRCCVRHQIVRTVLNGRSTYHCPACQKR